MLISSLQLNFDKLLKHIFRPDYVGISVPLPIVNRPYSCSVLVNPPKVNSEFTGLYEYDVILSGLIVYRLPAGLQYSQLPTQSLIDLSQYFLESATSRGCLQYSADDWSLGRSLVWGGSVPRVVLKVDAELNTDVYLHDSEDWLLNTFTELRVRWGTDEAMSPPIDPVPDDLDRPLVEEIRANFFRDIVALPLSTDSKPDGENVY